MSASFPHPDPRRLAEYRAGRVPAPERLAISDHLVDCPACRAHLGDGPAAPVSRPAEPDLLPIPEDARPGYDEMAALLDGTLDEAQSAEVRGRISVFPHTAAEFADLERFRDETATLPAASHGPRDGVTDTVCEPARGKVVAFTTRRWAALTALAAALVGLLAVGGWWVSVEKGRDTTQLGATADLSALPDDLRRSVEQAAQTGSVEVPPLPAALRPPAVTLAGPAPTPIGFRQITPTGVVVQEDRPVLRWTACAGAESYTVYLADTDGRAPMLSGEVSAGPTEWSPSMPLTRGTIYEWQVEARRGAEIIARVPRPPAPETRFQLLGEKDAANLALVEAHYRQDPLVLGTAYERLGLVEAATGQFMELQRRYPQSAAARQLLREARARTEAQN